VEDFGLPLFSTLSGEFFQGPSLLENGLRDSNLLGRAARSTTI
jgi:hypothetical protein